MQIPIQDQAVTSFQAICPFETATSGMMKPLAEASVTTVRLTWMASMSLIQKDFQMTKIQKLSKLLETLDIPEMRRNTLEKHSTLRWLSRNLRIKNAGKPQTAEALEIIKELMRGQ